MLVRGGLGMNRGEMTDPEALVDYKLAVLDAIRAELAEERAEKIVMIEMEGAGNNYDLQFYTLRFSLSGERLAALDEAWLRCDPGATIKTEADQ